jgi:hypothetical protein
MKFLEETDLIPKKQRPKHGGKNADGHAGREKIV